MICKIDKLQLNTYCPVLQHSTIQTLTFSIFSIYLYLCRTLCFKTNASILCVRNHFIHIIGMPAGMLYECTGILCTVHTLLFYYTFYIHYYSAFIHISIKEIILLQLAKANSLAINLRYTDCAQTSFDDLPTTLGT